MSAVKEWLAWLSPEKRKLLTIADGRRAVCKMDFKSFCFVYFRDVMKSADTDGEVTLSEFHKHFMSDAIRYTNKNPGPAQSRNAWVCPRGAGKSTMLMMLIIWLGAYKHQKFVAIFSATTTQSEDMLSNIRSQFDSNELLRADFPDLVTAGTRKQAALKLSDNKQLIIQKSGFIVTGRGIDTSVLGMRIDNTRPQVIILDDIEKSEGATTKNDVDNLLKVVQDDIFPLGLNAHCIWVGTTTRPGGLTEDLVHKNLGMMHRDWADTEHFKAHYVPALITNDDGSYRSMWPERWALDYLLGQQNTRSFKKNYMCLPAPEDSPYWSADNIVYQKPVNVTHWLLSVDPAVTSKTKSDQTGLAVIGWSQPDNKVYVVHVEGVRLGPEELRTKVLSILTTFPEIGLILAETNNGGEYILSALHHMPVKVKSVRQTARKELRAANTLVQYERGRVFHVKPMPTAENQMFRFPNDQHDDMVDAITTGVMYFFTPSKTAHASVVTTGYV